MRAPGVLVHAGPLAGLVLCCCLPSVRAAAFPQTAPAAGGVRAAPSVPGDALVRDLGPDERHAYDIDVAAGETVVFAVEQRGVDVASTVVAPDGGRRVIDTPSGRRGTERLIFSSAEAATLRLEIAPAERAAPGGRYAVRLVERRTATPEDETRARAWDALGRARAEIVLATSGSFAEAVRFLGDALPLFQSLNDAEGEAFCLFSLGFVHLRVEPHQAPAEYERARAQFHEAGNRRMEAMTLVDLSSYHMLVGDGPRGLGLAEEALALWEREHDPREEAGAISNVGKAHFLLGHVKEARERFERALVLSRAEKDPRGIADALNGLALMHGLLGESDQALALFPEALAAARTARDSENEAAALVNQGLVRYWMGEYDAAIESFDAALEVTRTSGYRYGEANALYLAGMVHRERGDGPRALDHYVRALEVFRATGDRIREGTVLNQMGRFYDSIGDKEQATSLFEKARALYRAVGNELLEAAAIEDLGKVAYSLGDLDKALDHYGQALALFRAKGARRSEATVLHEVGQARVASGRAEEALPDLARSLEIHREVENRRGEALATFIRGTAERKLGRDEEARASFEAALTAFRAAGDRENEGNVLRETGLLWSSRDPEKAKAALDEALRLHRSFGYRSGEALTLSALARVEAGSGRVREAADDAAAALEVLEALRTKVARQELRISYSALLRESYDLYVDALMRLDEREPGKGHAARALEASERGRARVLLELVSEGGADIRQGVEPSLLETERELRQRTNALAAAQATLPGGRRTDAQAAAMKREMEGLAADYEAVLAEIRERSPRYAALTQPAGLTAAEIERVVDDDTTLLEYALGEERSYLWMVTPGAVRAVVLPGRAAIETAAREVYGLLTARNRPYRDAGERWNEVARADRAYPEAARRLSAVVLGPVPRPLTRRLIVVADGALQYIPFAALPAPDGPPGGDPVPLLERHEIVSLPSASTLALIRRETARRAPAPQSVAVFADPVFQQDDERVAVTRLAAAVRTSGGDGEARGGASVREPMPEPAFGRMPRLPFTRREAEAILAVAPQGMRALDFTASRATALGADLARYRVVHFATHAILDSEHPGLSGIVLSLVDAKGAAQDGFLRLQDLYNWRLGADLVVLSGCQTALGKEIRGEGLVGLARGFMYAGSPRVVASLWKVDDLATSALMGRFYREMMGRGLGTAVALQEAQKAIRADKRWRQPYYWAAFALQGEW
jgi:CHAT domain-containing protein/tetratricopeptide (TPR) repeat protein